MRALRGHGAVERDRGLARGARLAFDGDTTRRAPSEPQPPRERASVSSDVIGAGQTGSRHHSHGERSVGVCRAGQRSVRSWEDASDREGELWAHRLTLAGPRVCGVGSLSGREIGCAIRRRSIGRRRLADRAPVQRCAAGGPCVSELADMVYGRTAHMEATMSFLRRISNVSEPRRCAPKV